MYILQIKSLILLLLYFFHQYLDPTHTVTLLLFNEGVPNYYGLSNLIACITLWKLLSFIQFEQPITGLIKQGNLGTPGFLNKH